MDKHTPEQRHRNMAAVKGKNTKPEIAIRKLLHAQGYRFRLHRKDLPDTPDIVLPKYKIAIFINGCFWHQHENCKHAALPSTRREFWEAKLTANKQRDARNTAALQSLGYTVLTIWECEIKSILATRTIPNLPPREASTPTPDYSPLPDTTLMAADSPQH